MGDPFLAIPRENRNLDSQETLGTRQAAAPARSGSDSVLGSCGGLFLAQPCPRHSLQARIPTSVWSNPLAKISQSVLPKETIADPVGEGASKLIRIN